MISVNDAQRRLLQLLPADRALFPSANIALNECAGRYLAADIIAQRRQPLADLSAMDGYAVCGDHAAGSWRLIGESSAGNVFKGALQDGDAVRIFTGAFVPAGTDTVIIQENVTASDGRIALQPGASFNQGANIRAAGSDFNVGDILAARGARLSAGVVAAAAMAGYAQVSVGHMPTISIIATGDELALPGAPLLDEQIPSSNGVMLAAMLAQLPCHVRDHGIARDTLPALSAKIDEARGSDIIVTIGGASVGDHDLVRPALEKAGAGIDFWRVAMRPGKPMMAGTLGSSIILGLPGNPASAFVTAFLFLLPLVRHMAGSSAPWPEISQGLCAADIPAGGGRAEYLRAVISGGSLQPTSRQDSGMTRPLADANALIIRPVNAPALAVGSIAEYHIIDV